MYTHNPHTTHATCTHKTHQTTDRDLESVFVKRKVNAWKCAPSTTDCDPSNALFENKTVTPVTSVISCGQEFFSNYYKTVTLVI